MDESARRIPVTVAVGAMFLVAFTGWFAGVSVFLCAQRALLGAVGGYILAKLSKDAAARLTGQQRIRQKASPLQAARQQDNTR